MERICKGSHLTISSDFFYLFVALTTTSHCVSNCHHLCQGQLAYEAPLKRDLPRSSSPLHAKDAQTKVRSDRDSSMLPANLCENAGLETDLLHPHCLKKEETSKEINDSTGQSSVTNDFRHGNSTSSRTGFKPYKRCSVEAKERKAVSREETGNKKIRLPEEA